MSLCAVPGRSGAQAIAFHEHAAGSLSKFCDITVGGRKDRPCPSNNL